ncbi:MAG: methionyl-tRNA formyltransferase [Rhodospirillaceae bacterium]|nr:methionyl-tRNA formyltransferase [Rhodospirillaceae bacterium]
MGTPGFAQASLAALLAAGHEVAAVYSQPPRPAGRGHKPRPSPVHAYAESQGLEVRTPASLRTADAQAAFADLGLDAAVVAAYGLILPVPILQAPRLGCFNVHASLLPRWRGAAPIQRAILAGDTETGITIMQMDAGLDTGDMLAVEATPIGPATTADDLHDRLAAIGGRLVVGVLADAAAGQLAPIPQPAEGVTYAAKITREDGRIDWQDAAQVDRQVRALNPWPGTWFELADERIRVLAAELVAGPPGAGAAGEVLDDRLTVACGAGGAVRLTRLQRPGRGPCDADAFLRGFPIPAGRLLCPASS